MQSSFLTTFSRFIITIINHKSTKKDLELVLELRRLLTIAQ